MSDTETALLIDGLREEIRRLRAVADAAVQSHDCVSGHFKYFTCDCREKFFYACAALDKGAL